MELKIKNEELKMEVTIFKRLASRRLLQASDEVWAFAMTSSLYLEFLRATRNNNLPEESVLVDTNSV